MIQVRNKDLLFPEFSYKIIGCGYDVFNELGYGHSVKVYQKACAEAFLVKEIVFNEQVYYPVSFLNKLIKKSFLDFVVDEKVAVELKKHDRFSKSHIDQVLNYLKVSNLKLAILINFAKEGVVYKRIINFALNKPQI